MSLSEEAKKAKREYLRKWRKKNPDKVREHNQRSNKKYWERKAVEIKSHQGKEEQ